MKKIVLVILSGLLLWLVINLLSWIYLGYQFKAITKSNPQDIHSHLRNIKTWSQAYPYLSLGTYRLPLIHPTHQLIHSTSQVSQLALEIFDQASPIIHKSLNAESIPQSQLESIIEKLPELQFQLNQVQQQLQHPQLIKLLKSLGYQDKLSSIDQKITSLNSILSQINQNQDSLFQLLGYQEPQHIVVLLQNNMELWPTGGYLGSYASLWLDQGAVKDLQVQAIDVPNGQIKGYVEAPEPISTYTHKGGTPGWNLRSSNWNPDFPQGFSTIDWFFSQGGVQPIDTLVGINLIPIIELIGSIGGLELIDYQVSLTSDNFYLTTQEHTSHNFFPGSTQKRDFLSHVSRQLLYLITSNPDQYFIPLAKTIFNNLNTNQIIISTKHDSAQQVFNSLNWDGGVDPISCQPQDSNCLSDYLHVNEANLGINKTNCCLDRHFTLTSHINPSNSTINHQLDLSFENHNPSKPQEPEKWGGGYLAYVRLYLPQSSQIEGIHSSQAGQPIPEADIDQEIVKDKLVIGFPIRIEGGRQGSYQVDYQTILTSQSPDPSTYQLHLHKQSGIDSIPWDITITDQATTQTHSLEIDRDTTLTFPL